jgi:hypothetical protein
VEDDERSGRSRPHRTDENVEKARNLVHSDRRLSITAVAVPIKLDKEEVIQMLSVDLGLKIVSVKLVPRLFTDEQKQSCVNVYSCLSCQLTNFCQTLSLEMIQTSGSFIKQNLP